MNKVTSIAAVAGTFPDLIPGMQSLYLGNIKQSAGSGWETKTLDWMHANAYNEAVCVSMNLCPPPTPPPTSPLSKV